MRDVWEMFPEGLPSDYCDQVVARAMQLPVEEGVIGSSLGEGEPAPIRRSNVRWFDQDGLDRALRDDVMFLCRKANRKSFGFDLVEPQSLQFAEYHGSEGGNFNWHQDINWNETTAYNRKLSFIAQLSDPGDYEGGELEFMGYPSLGALGKKRGCVIIFPSFIHHRVTPVTSGVRYSLV